METEGRIIFTFKIFTEEPGKHLLTCLNIPDFVIPCNNRNKSIEKCRQYLDFLISVEKQNLLKNYTSAGFIDDGWHFQLIYSSTTLTYVNKYEGENKTTIKDFDAGINYNAILMKSKIQYMAHLIKSGRNKYS